MFFTDFKCVGRFEDSRAKLSEVMCSDIIYQFIGKRSSNMIASGLLTACHSRTERFHSDDVTLSAR